MVFTLKPLDSRLRGNDNFYYLLDMLPNHEILTIPVYCVTVIVLVIPPAVTVTELLLLSSGSPSELKVNVIVVPIVAPDGN